MKDRKSRQIDYIRISITDRCNFKCVYCIPEEGISHLKKEELLSFDEIITICKSVAQLGIKKVKLTGGEPLIRKDLCELIRAIKAVEGIEEITLTTNGFLLEQLVDDLIEAGVSSINISLDTLDAEKFKEITKVDGLEQVLRGIHKASKSSLKSVKVNVLAAKGLSEEAMVQLVGLAKESPIHVRFIELMPIGIGKNYMPMTRGDVFRLLEPHIGKLTPYRNQLGNGPAKYWEAEGFVGKIGFISAVTNCFCEECNRIRLTATGYLKLCLHSTAGLDLRSLMRQGISQEQLTECLRKSIYEKPEKHTFEEEQVHNDESGKEDKMMVQIGG